MQVRVARGLVILFFAVSVLGVVFYATWMSIAQGQRSTWSYSQLFRAADAGQVATVEISGQEATAIGKDGRKHSVTLSPDLSADAQRLRNDAVDVTFRQPAGGAFWLQVLIPNLILLALLGGGFWLLLRVTRTRPPS